MFNTIIDSSSLYRYSPSDIFTVHLKVVKFMEAVEPIHDLLKEKVQLYFDTEVPYLFGLTTRQRWKHLDQYDDPWGHFFKKTKRRDDPEWQEIYKLFRLDGNKIIKLVDAPGAKDVYLTTVDRLAIEAYVAKINHYTPMIERITEIVSSYDPVNDIMNATVHRS